MSGEKGGNRTMSMEIISPGALSTIQDSGRTGLQAMGFSPSGATDLSAMRLANILTGNDINEAVLETTLIGPTIKFHKKCVIAITGASIKAKLNGVEINGNQAIEIASNDLLEMGFAVEGCRCYLSVAGGLSIKSELGSKSTHLKCAIGGFLGRALKAGDQIDFAKEITSLPKMEKRKVENLTSFLPVSRFSKEKSQVYILRAVKGPQDDMFTEAQKKQFTQNTYQLSVDSNRMACKLEGKSLDNLSGMDIISDGIALGSIQISSNGLPIVMLCDRQTTGGYAKIGTVITPDISIIAQCKPGEKVCFRWISVNESRRIYKKELKKLEKLELYLNK